jgi:hypothetical protein
MDSQLSHWGDCKNKKRNETNINETIFFAWDNNPQNATLHVFNVLSTFKHYFTQNMMFSSVNTYNFHSNVKEIKKISVILLFRQRVMAFLITLRLHFRGYFLLFIYSTDWRNSLTIQSRQFIRKFNLNEIRERCKYLLTNVNRR